MLPGRFHPREGREATPRVPALARVVRAQGRSRLHAPRALAARELALDAHARPDPHLLVHRVRRLRDPAPLAVALAVERDGARLVLAGVSDYSAGHFDAAHRSDPHKALAGAPTDADFKVLLAHQPRSAATAAQAGFDLQLSGHTHGGQFLPWTFFVRMQQPFTAGLHVLDELRVYVSRGTGYWGPPKRFGAPSEITRVKLVPAH